MRIENARYYKAIQSSDTGVKSYYLMFDPLPEHQYFTYSNDQEYRRYAKKPINYILANFSSVLNNMKYKPFEKFYTNSNLYKKEMSLFPKELNFFVTLYDNNQELMISMLKFKSLVDDSSNALQDIDKLPQVASLIYSIIFTDSLMDSINEMIDNTYVLSNDSIKRIEYNKINSNLDIHKRTLYNAIEFEPEHQKILIKLAFMLKIVVVCLIHWYNLLCMEPKVEQIWEVFKRYVELVSSDIDIYNKMYIFGEAKILETIHSNRYIYDQQAIEGNHYNIQIQKCLEQNFIVRVLPKICLPLLSAHYSILGYLKTTFQYSKYSFIRHSFDKQYKEIKLDTSATSDEDYSVDIFLKYMKLTDEGVRLLQENALKFCEKMYVDDSKNAISNEEILYILRTEISKYQKILIDRYWTHVFNCESSMLQTLSLREYAKLEIYLYRTLLVESDSNYLELSGKCILPYILTGWKYSEVQISEMKLIPLRQYIINHPLYIDIIHSKFKYICVINNNFIVDMIENLCISKFKYRVYNRQDLDDVTIEFDQNKLVDEVLEFLYVH